VDLRIQENENYLLTPIIIAKPILTCPIHELTIYSVPKQVIELSCPLK
jgi:hypothetical protein